MCRGNRGVLTLMGIVSAESHTACVNASLSVTPKKKNYKQSDVFVKTVFCYSRCLKTQRFDETSQRDFSHKTSTFLYDENVK